MSLYYEQMQIICFSVVYEMITAFTFAREMQQMR